MLGGSKVQGGEVIRKLSANQKIELVRLFLPYWREDNRHPLTLMIARALYWNDISIQDALSIVRVICELTDDEKVYDWLEVVEDVYQNADMINIPHETWLQGLEVFEYEFNKLVMNLLNIIDGLVFAGNGSLYIRRSDRIFIKVDFESEEIYEIHFSKRGEVITYIRIMLAIPRKVVVLQSENKELFKITFRSITGALIHFEGDIVEITKRLNRALLIISRRKAKDVLSLIINGMMTLGLCEVQKIR